MLNDATPSFRELLLNRLTPPDDHDVRVIVRLKQRETAYCRRIRDQAEDGLDPGVKAVQDPKNPVYEDLRYRRL